MEEISKVADVIPVVSLVIPMFNEKLNVKRVIRNVEKVCKKTGYEYEIIIVDDGSIDNTFNIALECAESNGRIKVYSYAKNIGKGHAIKLGFNKASGNCVVFLDGDMEINPNHIEKYVNALKYGDLAIGSKNHPDSRVIRPPLRKFLSICFNYLVRLITGLEVSDTQSGLKAVRREPLKGVFSKLAVKRFAFDVELLTVSNMYGLKIVEMPIEIILSRTIFNPKEIFRMLLDLMGIKYRLMSGKYTNRNIDGLGKREISLV